MRDEGSQHIRQWFPGSNLPKLLINFGSKSLEFKRVYNVNHPEYKDYVANNPKII